MMFVYILLLAILYFVIEIWLKVRFLVAYLDKTDLDRRIESRVARDLLQFLIKDADPSKAELQRFAEEKKEEFLALEKVKNTGDWRGGYEKLEKGLFGASEEDVGDAKMRFVRAVADTLNRARENHDKVA